LTNSDWALTGKVLDEGQQRGAGAVAPPHAGTSPVAAAAAAAEL